MRWSQIQAEEIQYVMFNQAALTFSAGVLYTKLMTGLMGQPQKHYADCFRKENWHLTRCQLCTIQVRLVGVDLLVAELLVRSTSIRKRLVQVWLLGHSGSEWYQALTLVTYTVRHTYTHSAEAQSQDSNRGLPHRLEYRACFIEVAFLCFLFSIQATPLLTVAVSILTGLA